MLTFKQSAAGLHKHADGDRTGPSEYRTINMGMAEVASRLARLLGVTVSDQSGLAGGYDFTLNLPRPATAEAVKQAVLDQLGLELRPAADGQQVEFLVAEKVR